MSRAAKKSNLEKKDIKDFAISLTDARNLKITKEDLWIYVKFLDTFF